MTDVFSCLAIEQGASGIGALVVLLIMLAALIALVVRILRPVFRATLREGGSTTELRVNDQIVWKATGKAVALKVVLFGVLLVGGVLYLLSYLYSHVEGYYSVGIDAPNGYTLERVREKISHDTHSRTTVKVADSLKEFRIEGKFAGKCPSDFYSAICRTYYRDLRCTTSYRDSTVRIDPAASSNVP